LVFLCTLFGVAAQFFIKTSGMQSAGHGLQVILTNINLWAGLSLYGVSTVLLILALRDGELSLLYPVISLQNAWVTIMSVLVFDEKLNLFKILGIAAICSGVALLGRAPKR
jgi:multidrug transporter EmrE-like cation transporter